VRGSVGLLLEPTGKLRGEYRRVGYYSNLSATGFAKACLDVDCVALEWDVYFAEVSADENGEVLHIIDIV
jgi:hypothetical protein